MWKIGRVVAAAMASVVMSTTAAGQDAVQWRVEDGGNGHWYQVRVDSTQWTSASSLAVSQGGHLATLTGRDESDFVVKLVKASNGGKPWIGAFQDTAAEGYAEPAGGWRWVTAEPWAWTNWGVAEPNEAIEGEDYLHLGGIPSAVWNDSVDDAAWGYIIEWSADCNGDGIVDYGQILDGTFADDDADGVPDCCEDGNCLPVVQWRVEDGGNGHWYQLTAGFFSGLAEASDYAASIGGHVVTMTSATENSFVAAMRSGEEPPIILGAFQNFESPDYAEPAGGWQWVTGEPWGFTSWNPGEPQNGQQACEGDPLCGQNFMTWWRYGGQVESDRWDDVSSLGAAPWDGPTIVEWSADCNGDGIVDYGQILDGTFADLDRNGIPDCCEPAYCMGDLNGDGSVGPPDLGILLAVWGTDGGKIERADINEDGTVDAVDLGFLIAAWGDCSCN